MRLSSRLAILGSCLVWYLVVVSVALAAPVSGAVIPASGSTIASEDLPDIQVVFTDAASTINAGSALMTVDGRTVTPTVVLSNGNRTATLSFDADLLPVGYSNPSAHTVVASIANTAAQRSADASWGFTQVLPGGAREMAPTAETACKGCHSSVDDTLAFKETHWIRDQYWAEPAMIIGPHYGPNTCANCHAWGNSWGAAPVYGAWGLKWTEASAQELLGTEPISFQQRGTTRYFDRTGGNCSAECHGVAAYSVIDYHRLAPENHPRMAPRGTPPWRAYVYNNYDDATKYEVPDARYRYDCLHCHQGVKGSQTLRYPIDQDLKLAHDLVGDHESALPSANFCAGCHSRVLTREHAAPGRVTSSASPVECSSCHESADPVISALREDLPTIRFWRDVSRSYYQVPLHDHLYDRLDAPVDAPSGTGLVSAHLQALVQDDATILVQAKYGTVWQTVYSKIVNNPGLTPYPGVSVPPPYNAGYTFVSEDITFAPAASVRISVDPYPDDRIYATGPFYTQGIEYWSETYVSLERIESAPLAGAPAADADCLTCHDQVAGTEHYAVHGSSFESAYCVTCHSSNLLDVPEHADAQGRPGCALCHDPASGPVADAVSAGETGCLKGCHTDHPHPAAAITGVDAGNGHLCTECHSTSLYLEHRKSTRGGDSDPCLVCHVAGGAADDIVGAWDTACDTSACHSAGSAIEVHTNYCLACHDENQPDFATSKTAFPKAAPVDRDTVCRSCHIAGLVGTHPYHQAGANCGAACHPGWGNTKTSAVPGYVDPVSGASFASAGSKTTPPAVLHTIHAATRWPSGVSTAASACASCHSAAACGACHADAVPATHGEHSTTDPGANPAWTGVVGHGVVGTDQSQRTYYSDTNQCAASTCHDLNGTAQRAPHAVEDYNHAVGGNPDDPTVASTAVSVTGTWRSRASTRYSGARMSYNGVAGSTLSATVTGERVEIVSDRDPYRGQAEVLVDGVVVGEFDAYAAVTRFQATVFSADLTPGAHTVTVRPTGERSASARAAYVVVDAFRTYTEVPSSVAPDCVSCHTDRAGTHW